MNQISLGSGVGSLLGDDTDATGRLVASPWSRAEVLAPNHVVLENARSARPIGKEEDHGMKTNNRWMNDTNDTY